MPIEVIRVFGMLKKASAIVNMKYKLDKEIGQAILRACDEVSFAARTHAPRLRWPAHSG